MLEFEKTYFFITFQLKIRLIMGDIFLLGLGYQAFSWEDLDDCTKKHPSFRFDLIVDTSGSVQAMEKSFSYLEVGGKLVIFGVADPDLKIS